MDESTTGRYAMILGIDLLTEMGLDLKFYGNVIIVGNGPYGGCSSPMVDASNYNFTYLTNKTVKLKESFINVYAEE